LKTSGYKVLRFEDGRRVFINPKTGQTYHNGEVFKQLELAQVLRNVSQFGVDYMYGGDWGREFVKKVNEYGGNMTMEDMINYKPVWNETLSSSYLSENLQFHTLNYPSVGGVSLLETMNIIENLGISIPYNESSDSLYKLTHAARWSRLLQVVDYFTPSMLKTMFPGIDLSFKGRISKNTAKQVYQLLFENPREEVLNRWYHYYKKCERHPNNPCQYTSQSHVTPPRGHSDSLTVADRFGNVVAMVHSINSLPFGTGLVVRGIALPDARASNTGQLTAVKGGQQILNVLQPMIALLNGKPISAQGTIGGGLHEYSILNLVNIFNLKKLPKQAAMMPHFQDLQFRDDGCFPLNETIYIGVEHGGFSEALVKETQQTYEQCFHMVGGPQEPTSTGDPGYIAQIFLSPVSSLMLGAVDNQLNGWSEGVN